VTILWKRLDQPGTEWCQLQAGGEKAIRGVVVFSYEMMPCRMEYIIKCDSSWETRSASITGQIGNKSVSRQIKVDAIRHWFVDGKRVGAVDGCIDIDLGFSPSTNLLPIRRLRMRLGERREVRAAWVEFPSLKVKLLNQIYLRSGRGTFSYKSEEGSFKRELLVNKTGLVLRYPGYWEVEAEWNMNFLDGLSAR
jgi:hypothetical protein